MAEVALIGALGGPIFSLLLANLISPAIEDIKREFGFEELLNKLQDSAAMIKGFLSDAQKKQVEEDAVIEWLKQLDAPASKANAIIENFKRKKELFQLEKENKVTFCCIYVKFHFSKAKFAREIEKVLQSFDVINNRAEGLGLQFQLANAGSITLTSIEPQTELSLAESNILRSSTNVSEIVEIPDTAPPEGTLPAVTCNYNMSKTELEIPDLERLRLSDRIEIVANLAGDRNLIKLVLGWNESRVAQVNDQDVLNVLRPHSNLESLKIIGYQGKNFPRWNILHTSLTSMTLKNCGRCKDIPAFESIPYLESLFIDSCASLVELPGLDKLRHLQRLNIIRCEKLELILGISVLLRELKITKCKRLTHLPPELLESCSSSIEELWIYELDSLETTLGPFISKMSKLRVLRCYNIPNLTDLPKSFSTKRLKKLTLGVFKQTADVESLNDYLMSCKLEQLFGSLRSSLELVAEKKWDSLPVAIQRLRGLTIIEFRDFTFEDLPEWFGELSSLKEIWFSHCEKLQRLPSQEAMQGLANLSDINFGKCPLMENRCSQSLSTSYEDPELSKIKHIQNVEFDKYYISYGHISLKASS